MIGVSPAIRSTLLALVSVGFPLGGIAAESAGGYLIDRNGRDVGRVNLAPLAAGGVHLIATIDGLPPGTHAFHIHETGTCNADAGFKSAGGHHNPDGAEHGWEDADGPHAGDMPNLHVPQSGGLAIEYFLTAVSLDQDHPSTLFDDDGSAIVIHQGLDDYSSEPSGAAGERIACAVIESLQSD